MHCYSPIIPPFQASGPGKRAPRSGVGRRKRQKKMKTHTINPFALKFVKGTSGLGLYGVPDGHTTGECYIGRFSSGEQTVQLPGGEYIINTFTMAGLKEWMPSVFDGSRTIEIMDIKELTAKDKFAREGDVNVIAKVTEKLDDEAPDKAELDDKEKLKYYITVYMSKEMSEKMIRRKKSPS